MKVKHADMDHYQKMILLYPEDDKDRAKLKEFADEGLGELKIGAVSKEIERLNVPIELLIEIFENIIHIAKFTYKS